MLGQVLYLEAQAAGVRATGIGCFYDDLIHELLGISDRGLQSIYHFAVGRSVDDPRITSTAPYASDHWSVPFDDPLARWESEGGVVSASTVTNSVGRKWKA